jgi:hypothetical protein
MTTTQIAKTPPLLDEANLPTRISAPLRAPVETGPFDFLARAQSYDTRVSLLAGKPCA